MVENKFLWNILRHRENDKRGTEKLIITLLELLLIMCLYYYKRMMKHDKHAVHKKK